MTLVYHPQSDRFLLTLGNEVHTLTHAEFDALENDMLDASLAAFMHRTQMDESLACEVV